GDKAAADTGTADAAAPTDEEAAAKTEPPQAKKPRTKKSDATKPATSEQEKHELTPAPAERDRIEAPTATIEETGFATAHAGPSVRAFARELGVNLGQVRGSGRKGRITSDDVKAFVK
ncbi:MAG: E3 binding domain-containing protein, partial [Candidatus Binatia bacterium]